MNRLLHKNKKREDPLDCTYPRTIPTPEPAQQQAKRRWGRKKLEPEAKPDLDVSIALPSSDDFRTSLIMPNLSARFSMLREQDDPSSLLGKASDDSVLTSKRRSRLADFTGTGLHDIAEVSSIRSIPRPPFAAGSRINSYQTDGSATDDESLHNGSMMGRARPGEGNMLFGGRQKIYKIPIGDAGSVKALGLNESRGMRGRALYEDDVHMSAFQKMKEREKQAERERRLAELEREMQMDEAGVLMTNSPSLSTYDEKRETTSSTNSGPSIMSGSTTATSIASHGQHSAPGVSPSFAPPQSQGVGLQRSNSRRLYEQGLDQHMSDHQNAALTRLNSIQRKGSLNAQSRLQHSRSAGNLQDPFDKGSSNSSRAPSPLPPHNDKLTTFDSIREAQSQPGTPTGFMPHRLDAENPLNQALQPSDRGKATALGSFNRPKQYDEAQFLVRQQSLHKQRSESRNPRTAASPAKTDSGRPSAEGRYGYHPRPSFESRSRAGTNRSDFTRPSLEISSRAGTGHSDRSFSAQSGNDSAAQQEAANVESPTLGGLQEVEDSESSPSLPSLQTAPLSARPNTFLDSPTANDDTDNLSPRQLEPSPNNISLERGTTDDLSEPLRSPPPPIGDHPAMRDEAPPSPIVEKRKGMSPAAAPGGFVPPQPQSIVYPEEAIPKIGIDGEGSPEVDSAGTNRGLSTVRQHLRQLSNVSSVYPDDTEEKRRSVQEFNMPIPTGYYADSGSWDAETFTPPPQHAIPAPLHGSNASVAAAPPITNVPNGPLPQRPQDVRPSDAADWMRDMQIKQHARGGSTETEHERKAFAEDLRQRKQAIQENLKHKNENSPRSQSPATFNNGRGNVLDGPLKMLRTRTSRENMTGQDSPNRMPRPMGPGPSGNHGPMQDRSVSSPTFRGMHPGPSQVPVGRTLHSRMPERREEGRDALGPLHDHSKPRQNGFVSPPDSSRASTSRDDASSGRPSERSGRPRMSSNASSDIQRRDFPSQFSSTRPSVDSNRGRSDSNNSQARGPANMPPLRMHNTAPGRPMMTPTSGSPISTASAPFPSPKPHLQPQPLGPSSFVSTTSTPPPATTMFRPAGPSSQTPAPTPSPASLLGQTNTTLAQTPFANQSLSTPQTLPSSTYTFPARTPAERPAARSRAGRAHINKSDISDPTLISSTSTFDTVALAEKRAQFAREAASLPNVAVGANGMHIGTSSAPSSPALGPPPVPHMNQTRRGFFQRGSRPEAGSRSGSAASGHYNNSGAGSPAEEAGHGYGHGFPGSKKNGSQEEDDFVTRPSGGRLRIRKVSSDLGARRRHEAVTAGLVEGEKGRDGGFATT